MMMHLSFEVTDLDAAVADAIARGARRPDHQPLERTTTLLDPDGHPFCLYAGE